MLWIAPLITGLLVPRAHAVVDDTCTRLQKPADYDEQTQTDFLANYPTLVTAFTPLHGPIPHRDGHGAVGIDLLGMPPLGCGQRFVAGWTKTEETNIALVIPRPRATFGFSALGGKVYPYVGVAAVPPVPIKEMRSTVFSAELGAGVPLGAHGSVGIRVHGTMIRTVGDIASHFAATEPNVLDVYIGSSSGADASVAWEIAGRVLDLSPYLSAGILETSSFFWAGDDSKGVSNTHPYFGPAFAAGLDMLAVRRLRVGLEASAAPGGTTSRFFQVGDGPVRVATTDPDPTFSQYGSLYTARLRLGVEL